MTPAAETENLGSLTTQALIHRVDHLVSEERKITAELIRTLREVERRRLHLAMGYGSMFDLLTKHYHFSEGAASRRIAAMRLSKQLPDAAVEQSIEAGRLTLSTASQVQHFLQNEQKLGKAYSMEEKRELTLQMEGKSRRECERELLKISPQSAVPQERARQVSSTETEIRFIADDQLMKKLERLRELLAHHGNLGYAELFGKVAELALKKLDPLQQGQKRQAKREQKAGQKNPDSQKMPTQPSCRTASPPAAEQAQNSTQASAPILDKAELHTETGTPEKSHRPHVPAQDRRWIWQRAQGCCEYIDPKTSRRCISRWALELDHIVPLAKNGPNDRSNFRLVCRNHNTWLAIQELGLPVMERFLKS